jgi:hypothetical protein
MIWNKKKAKNRLRQHLLKKTLPCKFENKPVFNELVQSSGTAKMTLVTPLF